MNLIVWTSKNYDPNRTGENQIVANKYPAKTSIQVF